MVWAGRALSKDQAGERTGSNHPRRIMNPSCVVFLCRGRQRFSRGKLDEPFIFQRSQGDFSAGRCRGVKKIVSADTLAERVPRIGFQVENIDAISVDQVFGKEPSVGGSGGSASGGVGG